MKNNLTIQETFDLAIQNHKLGNFKIAKNLYQKILNINPKLADVQNKFGNLFYDLNEYKKAINCYKKSIKFNPSFSNSYNNLGMTYNKLGDDQKAITYYLKAIVLETNHIDTIFKKKNENKLLSAYFDISVIVDTFCNLGLTLRRLREHQKAINSFKKAIQIDPNNIIANFNLGLIFKEVNNNEEAKKYYEKVIKLDAKHIAALNNLGLYFYELGENKKAISCYNKAIKIDPNSEVTCSNLGLVLHKLKMYEKAIKFYQKAITINSNYAIAYHNLGVTFEHLKRYKKSISCHHAAIKINPLYKSPINSLVAIFKNIEIKQITETSLYKVYKEIFLFLFDRDDISHSDIVHNAQLLLFSDNKYNEIYSLVDSGSPLLENKTVNGIIIGKNKELLLFLMLQKCILKDKFLVKLFTKLRYELLFSLSSPSVGPLLQSIDFLTSLSEQCRINKFSYKVSKEEKVYVNNLKIKVEKKLRTENLEIAILSCYMPLQKSKIIVKKILESNKNTHTDVKGKNFYNDLIVNKFKALINETKN